MKYHETAKVMRMVRSVSLRLAVAGLIGLSVVACVPVNAQDTASGHGGQRGSGGRAGGRGAAGAVVAVTGSQITVKNERGETWTVITTDNTRMMKDRLPVKMADVKAGDQVMAMGVPDEAKHEVHAAFVVVVDAAAVAKAKENMGKTYIAGRVMAIDETKLTIERQDKVSQVIEVDESTSFKKGGRNVAAGAMGAAGLGGLAMGGGMGPEGNNRGGGEDASAEGESITLADIKVGDNVVGTGEMKGAMFVPKQLDVIVRPPRREGARGSAPSGEGAPQM